MKKPNSEPMLIVMRAADMWNVHPRTDFTRVCDRCRELVGIFPSGQELLREYPETEIVCGHCFTDEDGWKLTAILGNAREAAECVDITKAKRRN